MIIKKSTILSISALLTIGSFTGCSVKNCDPSEAGFFTGIGCEFSGAYDERLSIFGMRVQVAKDKYLQTLLEYQEMVATITEDHTQIEALKEGIDSMNNEAIEIEQIITEIDQEEQIIKKLKREKKREEKRVKIKQKKRKLVKKLKKFSKSVKKVAKASVVSKKQKKIVMKKLKSGKLDKKTSVKLEKFTQNSGVLLAKAESEVLKNTEKTMYLSQSLVKMAEANAPSSKLKQEGIGLILRAKNIHKTKKIHTLNTRNKHKSLL